MCPPHRLQENVCQGCLHISAHVLYQKKNYWTDSENSRYQGSIQSCHGHFNLAQHNPYFTWSISNTVNNRLKKLFLQRTDAWHTTQVSLILHRDSFGIYWILRITEFLDHRQNCLESTKYTECLTKYKNRANKHHSQWSTQTNQGYIWKVCVLHWSTCFHLVFGARKNIC
jgi:hypothetical protein